MNYHRSFKFSKLVFILVVFIFFMGQVPKAHAAVIRQEINILDSTNTGTNAIISTSELASINTASYSGTVSFYFEVVGSATAGSGGSVRLRRVGTTQDDATFTTSNLGTSMTRYRTPAPFTPPAGISTTYFVYADAGGTSKTVTINSARIIIVQNTSTNPLTSTETQIEVGNKELAKVNTGTPVALSSPKYWTYTASKWDGTTVFSANVTYSTSTTNLATIRLQEDNGAFGTWTDKVNIVNGVSKTTVTLSPRVTFTPTDGRHYRIAAFTNSGNYSIYNAKIIIDQTGPGDVSTASYASKFKLVSAQDPSPRHVYFSSDGTKMYMTGNTNATIFQYTLSVAWDVSTAVFATGKFKLVSAQDTSPESAFFSPDGTKMYVSGGINSTIFQYTLSVAWDVSTAVFATGKFKLVSAQDTMPIDVFFSSDGTNMYITGLTNSTIFQYTLSTAWDVSTATYASKSKVLTAQDPSYGSFFSSDGTKMYTAGYNNPIIYQYVLTTPWDVSTATYTSKNKNVSAQDLYTNGVSLSSDAGKMYVMGGNNLTVYQYTLNSTYPTLLEPQYMLLNKADSGSTGLQNYKQQWNASEWSGVGNIFKYSHDATNALDSSKLTDVTASLDITNATVTGANQQIESSFGAQGAGNKNWQSIAIDQTNHNVYAVDNTPGDIYKQTGGSGSFVSQSAGSKAWQSIAIDSTTHDVYADYTNGDIYKQTGGSGSFVSQSAGSLAWGTIAIDQTNHNVYAIVSSGDIYKQTGGSGSFVSQSAGTKVWIALAIDSTNHDVYASVNGGDIYKQSGGSGSFVAQGIGTGYLLYSIAIDSTTHDVYAVDAMPGDIYKRIGGSGSLVAQGAGSKNWQSITIDQTTHDVYAEVNGGDIYKQTGGSGSFVSQSAGSQSWQSIAVDQTNQNVYSVVWGSDIYKSGAVLVMPTDGHEFDVNVTNTTGEVDASRILVATTLFGPLDHYSVAVATPQTAGICSTGTNTVTAQDASNNNLTGDTSIVNMTSNGSGITFYTDGTCGTPTSQYTLSSGVANIYYIASTPQSFTITATKNGSTETGTSSSITVNSGGGGGGGAHPININRGVNIRRGVTIRRN